MAKFELIFLAVLLVVAVATAARVARDAPEDKVAHAFDLMKKTLTETLSPENINKMIDHVAGIGDKLKEMGHEIAGKLAKQ